MEVLVRDIGEEEAEAMTARFDAFCTMVEESFRKEEPVLEEQRRFDHLRDHQMLVQMLANFKWIMLPPTNARWRRAAIYRALGYLRRHLEQEGFDLPGVPSLN